MEVYVFNMAENAYILLLLIDDETKEIANRIIQNITQYCA